MDKNKLEDLNYLKNIVALGKRDDTPSTYELLNTVERKVRQYIWRDINLGKKKDFDGLNDYYYRAVGVLERIYKR